MPGLFQKGAKSLEPLDVAYNERLVRALIGRQLREDAMPQAHRGRPMFSFWGEELGFSGGDVHAQRAYRIYLSYDENRVITDAQVVVEGELISPCSGYFPEVLDEFDYETVLDWCMKQTRPVPKRRITMKRTLIVVDMQNDFIDGSLGTPKAQAIVPAVKAKIQAYRDRGDEIIPGHPRGRLSLHAGGKEAAGGTLRSGHPRLGAGSGPVAGG